ncbi:MAG: ATP-binding protein [Dissulfuribacterales bacterium]
MPAHYVLKAIAAFLNAEGRIIIVGEEDNGNVFGLESDYSTNHNSRDKFLHFLSTLIRDYISLSMRSYIDIRIENVDEKDIFVIEVEKSYTPVFVKSAGKNELYIRQGPTTRSMDPQETYQYIETNWG